MNPEALRCRSCFPQFMDSLLNKDMPRSHRLTREGSQTRSSKSVSKLETAVGIATKRHKRRKNKRLTANKTLQVYFTLQVNDGIRQGRVKTLFFVPSGGHLHWVTLAGTVAGSSREPATTGIEIDSDDLFLHLSRRSGVVLLIQSGAT